LISEFGLTSAQALAVFGSVRAVVEADGPAKPGGAKLLEVAGAALELPKWREIPAAQPREVARAFEHPTARRVLAEALLIPACIDEAITPRGEAVVREFAAALEVDSHWVRLLPALRKGNVLAIKRQLFRRSPDARRLFRRTLDEEGIGGLLRTLLYVTFGWFRDTGMSSRFRELAELTPGCLGRQLHDDIVSRGLSFPGERGGIPERMVHHDLMHVVNGYGTDPAGECELAGFYAGYSGGDPYTFIVIVLSTFQLGLPVSPPFVHPARGAFDPARVLAGFLRGRRLKVDIMGQWDYWSLMPLPIDEVRTRLGIADAPSPTTR
jgi:hypothetical protein